MNREQSVEKGTWVMCITLLAVTIRAVVYMSNPVYLPQPEARGAADLGVIIYYSRVRGKTCQRFPRKMLWGTPKKENQAPAKQPSPPLLDDPLPPRLFFPSFFFCP